MTKDEFAQSVKLKYPAYKDVDNTKLADAMIAKYPVYADKIEQPIATPQEQPMSVGGFIKNIGRNAMELPGQAAGMVNTLIPGTTENQALTQGVSQIAQHPMDTALSIGKSVGGAVMHPLDTLAKVNQSAYDNPINMFLNMYGVKAGLEGVAGIAKEGAKAITPKLFKAPYAKQFEPAVAQAAKDVGMEAELPASAQSTSGAVKSIESKVPRMLEKTQAAEMDFKKALDNFKNSLGVESVDGSVIGAQADIENSIYNLKAKVGANRPAAEISSKMVEPYVQTTEKLNAVKDAAYEALPEAIKSSGNVDTPLTNALIEKLKTEKGLGIPEWNSGQLKKLDEIQKSLSPVEPAAKPKVLGFNPDITELQAAAKKVQPKNLEFTPARANQAIKDLQDKISWSAKNSDGMQGALKQIENSLRNEFEGSVSTQSDAYGQAVMNAKQKFKDVLEYKQRDLSKNMDKFIQHGNISQAADELLNPSTATEDILKLQNYMGENKPLLGANTVRQILDNSMDIVSGQLSLKKYSTQLNNWGDKLDMIVGADGANELRSIKGKIESIDKIIKKSTSTGEIADMVSMGGADTSLIRSSVAKNIFENSVDPVTSKLSETKYSSQLNKWGDKLDRVFGAEDATKMRNFQKVRSGLDNASGAGLSSAKGKGIVGSIAGSAVGGAIGGIPGSLVGGATGALADLLSRAGLNSWLSGPTGQQWLTKGLSAKSFNATDPMIKLMQSLGISQMKGNKNGL